MDVSVMTMPVDKAKEAFDTYHQYLKAHKDDELKAIEKGYRVLSEGHGVLDLHTVMSEVGTGEDGLPKLAIVRAHATRVYVARHADGGATFSEDRSPHPNARFSITRLPRDTFGSWTWADGTRPQRTTANAIVPLVPPQYRPKFGLHNYHLLFEAVWEPVPPVDPFLLKHLGGALYAVLAEWDLTPLEQSVLKGRL